MSAARSPSTRAQRVARSSASKLRVVTEDEGAGGSLTGLAAPAIDEGRLEALAERAARGERAAFDELYGVLFFPIYRYVALQVATREDAEDLSQAIFERLAIELPTHRPGRVPFITSAFRLARSIVLREERRVDRRRKAEAAAAVTEIVLTDEAVLRHEEVVKCVAAIERLTPDQRQALALRYGAGLSAEAAARVMSRQAGTIRGLTFRALASIRRQLELGSER